MPKDIDFSGPYLKTERADHHIRKLEEVFRRHLRSNERALTSHAYNRSRKPRHIGSVLPRHTPTILGDALHNLRAALDHAYCILVEADGGTVNKRTKFPFTEKGSRKELEDSAKEQAKLSGGPSDKIIAVIFDEIQPYPGGKGEDLIKLHVLDIADKHMVLLPSQQRVTVEDMMVSGHRITGLTLITDGKHPAIELTPGARLEKGYNNKAAIEICFGDGQPFQGEPTLAILKGLAARVDETLRLLERRAKETA